MFKKWLKSLWPDSYVILSKDAEGVYGTHYVRGSKGIETVDESTFAMQSDEDRLPYEADSYLQEIYSAYPHTRLIYLTSASSCSAVAACSKEQMAQMEVDTSIIKMVCKGKFSSYISTMDLEEDKLFFKPYTLDYIYSPFFVLDELRGFSEKTTMCILHRQNRLIVAVYIDDTFVYGSNAPIGGEESFEDELEDDTLDEDLQADFDLEDLGDFEEEMEDMDDLDSMDDLDDMEDFDKEIEEEDEDTINEDEEASQEESELKEYDLNLYKTLKEVMSEFYNDELVQSDFIEKIEIYDTLAISENVYELIEEELFCSVVAEHIDLHKAVFSLMQKDSGNGKA
ncbi:MAG: hypothetical protein ACQERK_02630 [Campylobacterota bacterium]